MNTGEIVIIGAVRTPIGKFNGSLSDIPATDLGAAVIREAIKRSGVKAEDVDEVIMGNVIQAGLGQNPARQAAIRAGIPAEAGALTLNKVCGSGLKAVISAAQAVKANDAGIIIAGGMENMTRAPYLLEKARSGYRLGHGKLVDAMICDGLWDAYNDYHMGITAENTAEKYAISREEQDRYALESNKKAVDAASSGKFREEILPLPVTRNKKDYLFEKDEKPLSDTSLEKLSLLGPVFKKGGYITAGNASGISDGAAAIVVTSREKAEELGIAPLAAIKGYSTSGLPPEMVMMTPVPAVKKVLEKTGMRLEDIDLIELNEAFAAQSLAVIRESGFTPEKVNVKGGAIALGHPIGASGARILVTLLYAMKERKAKYGLATLCMGGGNGLAMILEM